MAAGGGATRGKSIDLGDDGVELLLNCVQGSAKRTVLGAGRVRCGDGLTCQGFDDFAGGVYLDAKIFHGFLRAFGSLRDHLDLARQELERGKTLKDRRRGIVHGLDVVGGAAKANEREQIHVVGAAVAVLVGGQEEDLVPGAGVQLERECEAGFATARLRGIARGAHAGVEGAAVHVEERGAPHGSGGDAARGQREGFLEDRDPVAEEAAEVLTELIDTHLAGDQDTDARLPQYAAEHAELEGLDEGNRVPQDGQLKADDCRVQVNGVTGAVEADLLDGDAEVGELALPDGNQAAHHDRGARVDRGRGGGGRHLLGGGIHGAEAEAGDGGKRGGDQKVFCRHGFSFSFVTDMVKAGLTNRKACGYGTFTEVIVNKLFAV